MAQTQLTISIENLAPVNGTLLTPFWFGFHNGNFDTHDPGRPASLGLERIAEDGIISAIDREFTQGGFGTVQGTVAGAQGALAPGETAQFTLALDGSAPNNRYFNYAAMLLPSNDFFVANNDEQEHLVFDRNGDFLGADFIVLGTEVFDAGTEVSNEVPANTCVGQQAPNTGITENGVIREATGFVRGGPILSDPQFTNADFTVTNYQAPSINWLYCGTSVLPALPMPSLPEQTEKTTLADQEIHFGFGFVYRMNPKQSR